MREVSHHGRTTAYHHEDRDGSGPGLVCIHGSGGTHSVWQHQHRLGDRFPITTVDLSGHGESEDVETPPGEETLAAYADDVIAVAEETGASVIVGNSLGGAIALHVAIERSFEPAGLILVGTGAKLAVRDDLIDWLENDYERAIDFLHRPNWLFHTRDERTLQRSKAVMRAVGSTVTSRDYRTCDGFDVRDRLEEVTAPTLAITGEHDGLTPPWYHEYLADHVQDGHWTIVHEAAHLSMLERPRDFNDAVGAFLGESVA